MDRMTKLVAATALLVLVGACGEADQAEEDTDAEPGMMEGMPGGEMGSGATTGPPTMQRMRMHMEMMQGLSGDSARAMMGVHRQMVEQMLSPMEGEMGEMEMGAAESQDALADSVREDLARMRGMGPDSLRALMPAHRDRVMRLMRMRGITDGG